MQYLYLCVSLISLSICPSSHPIFLYEKIGWKTKILCLSHGSESCIKESLNIELYQDSYLHLRFYLYLIKQRSHTKSTNKHHSSYLVRFEWVCVVTDKDKRIGVGKERRELSNIYIQVKLVFQAENIIIRRKKLDEYWREQALQDLQLLQAASLQKTIITSAGVDSST